MQQFVMQRGGVKNIISIPWTVDQLQYGQGMRDKVKDEADAFGKVPLLFRAVNLRCNTLTNVPYKFFEIGSDKEVEEYPYQDILPFDDLLWKTEASLLLRGASFCVRLQDVNGTEIGLQWLNPFTMKVKRVKMPDNTLRLGFQQYVDGKLFPQLKPYYWTEQEMFYTRQFSASDDVGFGTAAAAVALGSSRLQHYLTFFAAQFFENGAMPVTMVTLPGNTQQPERERTENFFRKSIQGLRNAWKVLAVSGETKATTLTPKFSELAVPNLKEHAVDDVAWAFDIPKSVLTAESANYATADIDMQSFLKNTIIPRTKFFEHTFNTRLLNDYGMRIEFHPQEMSELQEDEMNRSNAFRNYVLSGMWPQLAAAVLGIDIPKDFEEEWKKNSLTPGKKLDIVKPVETQGKEEQLQVEAPPKPMPVKIAEDIAKWKRKSLKRIEAGKSASVEFESDVIPSPISYGISSMLKDATTKESVNTVFDGVLNSYGAKV